MRGGARATSMMGSERGQIGDSGLLCQPKSPVTDSLSPIVLREAVSREREEGSEKKMSGELKISGADASDDV